MKPALDSIVVPRLIRSGHRNVGREALVGVLFVTGCGADADVNRARGQQAATTSGGLTATGAEHITRLRPSAIPPSRPWGRPVEGDEFSTLAEAVAATDFDPLVPTKLGHPAAIIVNPHQLSFVYDHPSFGIFYIQERKVDGSVALSQASIVEFATMLCPRPSSEVPYDGQGPRCPGKRSLEVLADGRKAALWLTEQGANMISFVDEERALSIDIIGQSESFGSVSAVDVANLLIG